MSVKLLILISLVLGILFFVFSIVKRKNLRVRRILQILGVTIGVLPILVYQATQLFQYIKERPLVGNYEGQTYVQGIASMDMFDDNTFILKSDSCSMGFVQGTWSYNWLKKELVFESTSQNMGVASLITKDSIQIKNLPVCMNLVRSLTMGKSGKPLTPPMEPIQND